MVFDRKPSIYNIPIRSKLIALAVLIILLPMSITGLYFYLNVNSILTQNADRELNDLINQINNNIQSTFEVIDDTSMAIISNPSIISDLNSDSIYDNRTDFEHSLNSNLIFSYVWNEKLLKTAFIIKDEDQYIFTVREQYSPEILSENVGIFKSSAGMKSESLIVTPSFSHQTIYFVRNVRNFNYPIKDPLAKLILGIDENNISKIYNSVLQYRQAHAFIFDEDGTIYSSDNKKMLGEKADGTFLNIRDFNSVSEVKVDGTPYLVAARKINFYNLTSLIAVPKYQILSTLSSSMMNYFMIILLIILISIASAVLIYSRVTRPVEDLMSNIRKVGKGDFSSKMPAYRDMDLNRMSSAFNNMTSQINDLISQVYEKQLLLKEAELKSLQSQINPHFLFNTLETISWKARMIRNDEIYGMVTSLGEFLRANISMSGQEKITVGEEMKYVEFYLYLQKIRFEDRLAVDIRIEDDRIRNFYLPKLSIQPIVENAIVHGLENKMHGGRLDIEIDESSGIVSISVTDNGSGFNTEATDTDTRESEPCVEIRHTHVGLFNTDRRIKLMYGEQYGISIQSSPSSGTRVTIKIPVDAEGK